MRKGSPPNPRLAPALARGERQRDASARHETRPVPTCALDELPDFTRQVEAAQEQARARRSGQERRAEIERAKLKSALTLQLEPSPPSAHEQPEHQEQPAHQEHRRIAPESDRAWAALVRHAGTTPEVEDSGR